MRSYAQIVPTFWTRGSGKKLRGKPYAQVLAIYFMTGPTANMIGLYYVPRITILNDTGIPESELEAALKAVADVQIAFYDPVDELVYVPECATYQVGQVLKPGDTKRKTILAILKIHGNHPFALQWLARYYEPYGFARDGLRHPNSRVSDTPSIPHQIPHVALPYTPGSVRFGSSDLSESGAGAAAPTEQAPIVADLQTRSQLWAKDPFAASLQYPNPELWTETIELNTLVATTFGNAPDALGAADAHGHLDSRVKVLLDRWAAGVPQARMRQAIRGAGEDDLIRSKPTLQSLQTIFKDGNAVDKYCRLAKADGGGSAARSRSNKTKLTAEAAETRRKFLLGEDP